MAVAPNASSSIIMGNTSPSIEPYRANAYRQDTLSGSSLAKNKWLNRVIEKYLSGDGDTVSQNAFDSMLTERQQYLSSVVD
jgi:ribonucleoside-diphosphate reductase alpha chain